MFKYKKLLEHKVRELHYLRLDFNELQREYNKIESEYKEYKQTSEEDYLKLQDRLDEQSNHCKLKSEYHQLFIKYKSLQQKLSVYENQKIIDIESDNVCKLCYETIDENKYKFQCPNSKCNKTYHVECILKITETKRNKCSYCKCDFTQFNYNFNHFNPTFVNDFNEYFSDYSEYDKYEINYNNDYERWISQNYYYDNYYMKNIIKIQSIFRRYLQKKKLNETKKQKDNLTETERKYKYYMENSFGTNRFYENDI